MTDSHDRQSLGAYALGALDPREAERVAAHVETCAECREELAGLNDVRSALGAVPPEAFLDGPPEGGDLLLRRTLRRARADSGHIERSRWLVAASFLVLALVAVGGGFLVGRETVPVAAPPVTVVPPPVTGVARAGTAQDPLTRARMAVNLVEQAGWVRVRATVLGAPKGARCLLLVVPRDGEPVVAGSWLVSEKGAREGTVLDGAALVDPAEVRSVDVVTTEGRKIVSVPI